MVKQKLTHEEEEKIAEQLKLFIKPRSLPDILRKALLSNKWIPEQYEIYIPKGDYDNEEHFINVEQTLKNFENNNLTDLDKVVIQRLLVIPKIVDRIDYEFRGLITKVKNSLINGLDNSSNEDEQLRLHHKPESFDMLTGEKIKKPKKKNKNNKEVKENDNANEKSHTGNIYVRGKDADVSKENIERTTETNNGTKPEYIEFGEEEDY